MRILILSQNYDPEPVPKASELAQELQLRGHDVSVVTGFPNYPSGKLYPGYKLAFLQQSVMDGIEVTRTYVYPYHGDSALGRILNYTSFMLSAPFSLLKKRHFDVIYVWHPPLTIGFAAWIISVLTRTPFVYDVQDIWPESVVIAGFVKNPIFIKLLSMLEKFVYKRAKKIFVVTNGARQNLIGKGVPQNKVSVMPHWTDEEIFGSADKDEVKKVRKEYGFEDRFVVMFAGNLGKVQGLDTIISAADILRGKKEILITFVGEGSDEHRLKDLVKTQELEDHVLFIERQPIEKILTFLVAADVLLVHLKSSPLADFVIPSKTTAYLAAGKPIIMATGGAAADLVQEIGAGEIIDSDDPEILADTIRDLSHTDPSKLIEMGQKGRNYFLSDLSKEKVIPLYENELIAAAQKNKIKE
jgi:glycosyltransferase involved in cell wall biosynthesis